MDHSKLIDLLQYQFKDASLLDRALTHRSFLNESAESESNERLEFLGDAVLELIITEYLYNQRPNDPEGVLTAARSAIVRTETLAKLASNLNLGQFLKISKGEERSGGRTNISLLANTTEAVIGAVYLDGGLKSAEEFITTHLLPLAQEIIKTNNFKDPKSLLQESLQQIGYLSPQYISISETGPDHNKRFTVAAVVGKQLSTKNEFVNPITLATGEGKSKQLAQQEAAKHALEVYEQILASKSNT